MTSSEPTDAALASRAARGDERAFSELVRRHKEPLYRLLRRYVGNADEAYEAAHEAFIAAWGAIGRYDPNRPFAAWLRTIAINKARDRGRRMAFRQLLFGAGGLDGPQILAQPDGAAPPDQVVMLGQEMTALDRTIANLPSRLKEPLLLTAFEGCSQREASEVLGVSVKTIETRVYRARRILAETLDPSMRPKA